MSSNAALFVIPTYRLRDVAEEALARLTVVLESVSLVPTVAGRRWNNHS
jgi:hypothetical protein